MILTLLFWTTVHANQPLPPGVRARVAAFRAAERAIELHPGHESVVRLHHDGRGRPVRTTRAALVISGLFNSPEGMRQLEEFFHRRGENVVNLRLDGHYEKDVSNLASKVRWSTWREQSARAFDLARELGEKVTVVGHSTGGLLGTWLTADHPDDVAGLAVFAPAFGLSVALRKMMDVPFDAPVPSRRKRVRTRHAGREVVGLIDAFDQRFTAADSPAAAGVARRIEGVPFWMGNSGWDRVIDLRAADRFYTATLASRQAPRHHERLSWCNLLVHDELAAGPHRRWATLMHSLERTIYPR